MGAENIIRPDGSRRGRSLSRSGLRRGRGWFLPAGRACCGMMVGCAASACLSECDGRVRVTAAACGQRRGQGRGDPGAASPAHGPAAAAGHGPATVLPVRPGVPGRLAALAAAGCTEPGPAAGASGDGSALAPGPAGPPPCGQVPSRPPGTAAQHPLRPAAGAAPGPGEPVLGLPAHPRRTARPRHQGRCLHGVGDPQAGRDRPRARPGIHDLGQLPPLAGDHITLRPTHGVPSRVTAR